MKTLLLPGMCAPPRSRWRALLWSCILLPAVVLAGGTPRQNTETADESQFRFELLPRAFQKNPLLEQTVITEMTAQGRKLPPPSSAQPAYYLIESAGNHSEGHGADERRLPKAEELAATFQQALGVNGYLPATAAHPPTLLIVYFWGAHTDLDTDWAPVTGSGTSDIRHRSLLSRAALVGGVRFATDLRQALAKQDREDETNQHIPKEVRNLAINTGPLQAFIGRDFKTRQLWEACVECYYAVASAYDYAAAQQGQRRLLWRTRMTLDAQGVAMRDTLPGLVLNAGKYFGVDMPEAATMASRMKEGRVTLAPLEYLDDPPAAEKKP